ncbi:hypothetical protein D3C73_959290 [compost metagenome]
MDWEVRPVTTNKTIEMVKPTFQWIKLWTISLMPFANRYSFIAVILHEVSNGGYLRIHSDIFRCDTRSRAFRNIMFKTKALLVAARK